MAVILKNSLKIGKKNDFSSKFFSGNSIGGIFGGGVLTGWKTTRDFELLRIFCGKLQTAITFDREVGWRRVKNESCSR